MTKTADTGNAPAIEAEDLGEFWVLHGKKVTAAAIIFAAVAGGAWLYRSSSRIKETKAEALFQPAEQSFMAGNQALAATELEKIVARYPGTVAGAQSAMLLAQAKMDQGKFDEALKGLEGALGSAPAQLKSGLLALIGAAQEGAGKPAEAAAAFGRSADAAHFAIDKDMQRMEQARNLTASGNAAGAVAIYTEIASREDSPFAGEAKVRLGEVSAKK